MVAEMQRIAALCSAIEAPEESLLNHMRFVSGALSKITTLPKLHDLCRQMQRRASAVGGKTIRVQATARSRRVRRAGMTSGAACVQSGRPSKFEIIVNQNKTKKRPHDLAVNIELNRPNARSHATGM